MSLFTAIVADAEPHTGILASRRHLSLFECSIGELLSDPSPSEGDAEDVGPSVDPLTGVALGRCSSSEDELTDPFDVLMSGCVDVEIRYAPQVEPVCVEAKVLDLTDVKPPVDTPSTLSESALAASPWAVSDDGSSNKKDSDSDSGDSDDTDGPPALGDHDDEDPLPSFFGEDEGGEDNVVAESDDDDEDVLRHVWQADSGPKVVCQSARQPQREKPCGSAHHGGSVCGSSSTSTDSDSSSSTSTDSDSDEAAPQAATAATATVAQLHGTAEATAPATSATSAAAAAVAASPRRRWRARTLSDPDAYGDVLGPLLGGGRCDSQLPSPSSPLAKRQKKSDDEVVATHPVPLPGAQRAASGVAAAAPVPPSPLRPFRRPSLIAGGGSVLQKPEVWLPGTAFWAERLWLAVSSVMTLKRPRGPLYLDLQCAGLAGELFANQVFLFFLTRYD